MTLTGTVASLAGSCPAVTFTVGGSPAATTASTTFPSGTGGSDIKNSISLGLIGLRNSEGRVVTRYVSVVKTTAEPEVAITGVLAAVAGTCPSLTFTVDGKPTATDSAAQYGGGGHCADVTNIDTRTVVGTKQADGRYLVRYVSGAQPTEATIVGVVAGLTGACPSVAFTLDGTPAELSSATIFGGGATCAAIKNGDRWGGAGPKQTDGRSLLRYVTVVAQ